MESCFLIKMFQRETVHPASTQFAALEPESPSSTRASSLITEPFKGLARIASMADDASELYLDRRESRFFESNMHDADTESRYHRPRNC